MRDDKFFMKLALNLAVKGLGKTSPNPVVGAVIVKNGSIVGRGYHRKAGLEHAEISALRDAKEKAAGATLYVTLEPCSHYGQTPPCTKAVIKSGVKRVVAAMKDPNPLNNGRGFNSLKNAGISVVNGILRDEAGRLNEVFIKYITKKRPFVIVKAAQSVDGKIATKRGDSMWISCEESRRFVHRLRSQVDAVMVGAGTVIKDDPLLTARSLNRVKGEGMKFARFAKQTMQISRVKGKQPIKIIVDSELKISVKSRIFGKDSPAKVIIAATKKASKNKIKKFKKLNCEILIMGGKNSRVDLKQLMKELGKRKITSVLAEGGGELIGSLADERLADKFLFFISPKIIGGRNAKTSAEGEGAESVKQALVLKDIRYKKIGSDLLIEAYPCSRA